MLAYQGSLFGSGPPGVSGTVAVERQHLDEHSWIDHAHGWLRGADMLLADLATTLRWRTGSRPMYGRIVDEPRLHARLDVDLVAARPALSDIVDALQRRYGPGLRPGVVNYYRAGSDRVAWHADRVGTRPVDPIVAIVSLGGPRRFGLRPMYGGQGRRIVLHSGDLLVMGGACQHHWEHSIPKMRHAPPRMSLTYRCVDDSPERAWWSEAVDHDSRG